MMTVMMLALALSAPAAVELTDQDRVEIGRIFEQVDANHDGRITRPEMAAFGASMKFGTVVRNRVWREMDFDRSGWISRDEFLANALLFKTRKAAGRR